MGAVQGPWDDAWVLPAKKYARAPLHMEPSQKRTSRRVHKIVEAQTLHFIDRPSDVLADTYGASLCFPFQGKRRSQLLELKPGRLAPVQDHLNNVRSE